jgi:transposase
MTKRVRRTHAPAFNAKMALPAIKGEKTLANFARQYDVHPNQIPAWKGQLVEAAVGIFRSGGAPAEAAPGGDVKTLHAKIGELTLENDFLSGALSEAGLLSAKRAGGRTRDHAADRCAASGLPARRQPHVA